MYMHEKICSHGGPGITRIFRSTPTHKCCRSQRCSQHQERARLYSKAQVSENTSPDRLVLLETRAVPYVKKKTWCSSVLHSGTILNLRDSLQFRGTISGFNCLSKMHDMTSISTKKHYKTCSVKRYSMLHRDTLQTIKNQHGKHTYSNNVVYAPTGMAEESSTGPKQRFKFDS